MSVDAHIPSRATETLPLTVRNMLLRLRVTILLRHPKVYHVNHVRVLRSRPAYEEVVGFDVPVDQILLVDRLYARNLPNDGCQNVFGIRVKKKGENDSCTHVCGMQSEKKKEWGAGSWTGDNRR